MTGHRGLPVHDGREALKAVEQKAPDLILLDMNLPDISGFELLEALETNSGDLRDCQGRD